MRKFLIATLIAAGVAIPAASVEAARITPPPVRCTCPPVDRLI